MVHPGDYGQVLLPKYSLGLGKVKGKKNVGGEKHGTKPPPSLPPHSSTPSFSLLYWRVYKSCSWLEFSLLTMLYTYKYIYIYINIFLFFSPVDINRNFPWWYKHMAIFYLGFLLFKVYFCLLDGFFPWILALWRKIKSAVCVKKKN